jgi:hypothetical protein
MTLASIQKIDRTEVLEDGTIQIRQAEVITKDGVEITRSFHRWVRHPGDTEAQTDPAPIPAITSAVWTPEVVSAYQAQVASQTKIGE